MMIMTRCRSPPLNFYCPPRSTQILHYPKAQFAFGFHPLALTVPCAHLQSVETPHVRPCISGRARSKARVGLCPWTCRRQAGTPLSLVSAHLGNARCSPLLLLKWTGLLAKTGLLCLRRGARFGRRQSSLFYAHGGEQSHWWAHARTPLHTRSHTCTDSKHSPCKRWCARSHSGLPHPFMFRDSSYFIFKATADVGIVVTVQITAAFVCNVETTRKERGAQSALGAGSPLPVFPPLTTSSWARIGTSPKPPCHGPAQVSDCAALFWLRGGQQGRTRQHFSKQTVNRKRREKKIQGSTTARDASKTLAVFSLNRRWRCREAAGRAGLTQPSPRVPLLATPPGLWETPAETCLRALNLSSPSLLPFSSHGHRARWGKERRWDGLCPGKARLPSPVRSPEPSDLRF